MLNELKIVNAVLRTIGTGGLTSSDTAHPDYAEALAVIDLVLTDAQKLGLWFNTSYPTLAPAATKEILLPSGTLHCDPLDTRLNYVKRGRKLFDNDKRTFLFDCPVAVKLVTELNLPELPESASAYVLHKARYDFYLDNDGDENKLRRLESARNEAWIGLWREHMKNRDVNRLDSPGVRRLTNYQSPQYMFGAPT